MSEWAGSNPTFYFRNRREKKVVLKFIYYDSVFGDFEGVKGRRRSGPRVGQSYVAFADEPFVFLSQAYFVNHKNKNKADLTRMRSSSH